MILQLLANATNVENNFLANETLGTILIKCTNSIFGKMIYKLLANATNVENNYLANETLKNHKNVNIHLRRTVNLKKHIRKQHYLQLNPFHVPLNPPICYNITTKTHTHKVYSGLRLRRN